MLKVVLFCLLVAQSLAYQEYQAAIPNGAHVPHPCKWTKELCQQDADGDGLTNGQELGDPHCTWSPGSEPLTTDGITHPGICDPFGSKECEGKNDWVTCETGEFLCDAIKEPDVRNLTVRLPRKMNVPTATTTYMCHVVDLPDDDTFHVIASMALIDNANILHHIIMFGCGDEVETTDEPFVCNMANDHCNYILGVWTVGMAGDCIYEDAGYRVGKGTQIKKAWLQFHWNNPHHHDDYTDQSGMTIFYTTKLRKFDASLFTVGQMKLNIPPGLKRHEHSSTCYPNDTRSMIIGPVNVTTALNHMHYMGIAQRVELWRDGQYLRNLADDKHYVYDDPKLLKFDPPVQLQPGDEFRTFCTYRSDVKSVTTYYDEMCYTVFSFYPAENMLEKSCLEWGHLDCESLKHGPVYGCDHRKMADPRDPDTILIFEKVLKNCNFHGECRSECPGVLQHLKNTNPCLQGELWDFVAQNLAMTNDVTAIKFLAAFETCKNELQLMSQKAGVETTREITKQRDGTKPDSNTAGISQTTTKALFLFTFVITFSMSFL